jgi:hypothetical protein
VSGRPPKSTSVGDWEERGIERHRGRKGQGIRQLEAITFSQVDGMGFYGAGRANLTAPWNYDIKNIDGCEESLR